MFWLGLISGVAATAVAVVVWLLNKLKNIGNGNTFERR